jgi:NhaP-type Na+/H+ or K+/H+ antiporter
MSIQLFLSGVMLGLLVGMLLGYCLSHRLQRREEKQGEIDRLVMQFQDLFRQIDRGKET